MKTTAKKIRNTQKSDQQRINNQEMASAVSWFYFAVIQRSVELALRSTDSAVSRDVTGILLMANGFAPGSL